MSIGCCFNRRTILTMEIISSGKITGRPAQQGFSAQPEHSLARTRQKECQHSQTGGTEELGQARADAALSRMRNTPVLSNGWWRALPERTLFRG